MAGSCLGRSIGGNAGSVKSQAERVLGTSKGSKVAVRGLVGHAAIDAAFPETRSRLFSRWIIPALFVA